MLLPLKLCAFSAKNNQVSDRMKTSPCGLPNTYIDTFAFRTSVVPQDSLWSPPVTAVSRAGQRPWFIFVFIIISISIYGENTITIDNLYDDWEAVPAVASFASLFVPPSFTRESLGNDFETLSLKDSRFWEQGGTRLNEVKAVADEENVYIFISTQSAISANLSCFFYLRGERLKGEENPFTLELIPEHSLKQGKVILWRRDRRLPESAGKLSSSSFFLEARINKQVFSPEMIRVLGSNPSLDLTTCYFDKQNSLYEEFFFTTIYFKDIPLFAEIRR
jgi:hypothetical protein